MYLSMMFDHSRFGVVTSLLHMLFLPFNPLFCNLAINTHGFLARGNTYIFEIELVQIQEAISEKDSFLIVYEDTDCTSGLSFLKNMNLQLIVHRFLLWIIEQK